MAEHDEKSSMQQESFLSRWSERKLNRSNGKNEIESAPCEKESPPSSETREQGKKESTALPLIDSLDENSDYSAFISPDVSEELQRLALRKLFSSYRFNVRDGLDDYDEDYRSFESLGKTITAEMRHHMERVQAQNSPPLSDATQPDPGFHDEKVSSKEDEQGGPPIPDTPSSDSG